MTKQMGDAYEILVAAELRRGPVMRVAIMILSVLVLLTGCGDPRDKPVPKSMSQMQQMQPTLEKLTPAERDQLGGFLMRRTIMSAFGGKGAIPEGMTIREALAEQKSWADGEAKTGAEAAALKAKVAKEAEAVQKEVDSALTIAFVGKKLDPSYAAAGIEELTLTFALQNKGTTDIAGVKGTAAFVDIFGDKISETRISYDKTVPAGESATFTHNMVDVEDGFRKLRDTEDAKIKFTFVPGQIVFSDGTKLVVPAAPN